MAIIDTSDLNTLPLDRGAIKRENIQNKFSKHWVFWSPKFILDNFLSLDLVLTPTLLIAPTRQNNTTFGMASLSR